MLQRWAWIGVAAVGAGLVLGLIMAGRDAARAARTGPRWRRLLLEAGFAALSLLGLLLAARPSDRPAPAAPTGEEMEAEWLRAVIRALEVTLASWPEDIEAVRAVLAEADGVQTALPAAPPEDWWPSNDIDMLDWSRRDNIRVTVPPSPAEIEREKLRDRMDELQRQAALRLARATGDITDTVEWRTITQAWRRAAPWSPVDCGDPLDWRGGSGGYGGLTVERHRADWEMGRALKSIDRLETEGLLVAAEAGLLRAEAERLRRSIYRSQADDLQVTCYRAVFGTPKAVNHDRLQERLALLKKLDVQRRTTGPVVEKILAAILGDIEMLDSRRHWGSCGYGGTAGPRPPSESDILKQEVLSRLRELGVEGGGKGLRH